MYDSEPLLYNVIQLSTPIQTSVKPQMMVKLMLFLPTRTVLNFTKLEKINIAVAT